MGDWDDIRKERNRSIQESDIKALKQLYQEIGIKLDEIESEENKDRYYGNLKDFRGEVLESAKKDAEEYIEITSQKSFREEKYFSDGDIPPKKPLGNDEENGQKEDIGKNTTINMGLVVLASVAVIQVSLNTIESVPDNIVSIILLVAGLLLTIGVMIHAIFRKTEAQISHDVGGGSPGLSIQMPATRNIVLLYAAGIFFMITSQVLEKIL